MSLNTDAGSARWEDGRPALYFYVVFLRNSHFGGWWKQGSIHRQCLVEVRRLEVDCESSFEFIKMSDRLMAYNNDIKTIRLATKRARHRSHHRRICHIIGMSFIMSSHSCKMPITHLLTIP